MRRWVIRIALVVLVPLAAVTLFLLAQLELGNFHEVLPGELYRSAQPTQEDLTRYTKEHGIKSVLNLRGGNPADGWYQEEIAASEELHITHLDFRMKAARELTDAQVAELIEVMRSAPKPLLIHCRSGADRTGLAAALYLEAISGKPMSQASGQLSLRYGHLPFGWTDAQAMDRTLAKVAKKR